jgi:outer membrane protein OmpA-like peptidoglycan-associated protein
MTNLSRILSRRPALAVLAALCLVQSINCPARAQPQSFSIFFDKQKSVVTPTAKQIIALIKEGIKKSSRVIVAGHPDTSEVDPDRLSLGRAMEVQKELVAQGVPAGVSLTIVGKGTTELRIKTGPNVSETQNRFVTVTVE